MQLFMKAFLLSPLFSPPHMRMIVELPLPRAATALRHDLALCPSPQVICMPRSPPDRTAGLLSPSLQWKRTVSQLVPRPSVNELSLSNVDSFFGRLGATSPLVIELGLSSSFFSRRMAFVTYIRYDPSGIVVEIHLSLFPLSLAAAFSPLRKSFLPRCQRATFPPPFPLSFS